jgi:hypothetical protein
MLVFMAWLILQFGRAPALEQLADSAQNLIWVIAGVYTALWLIRVLKKDSRENGTGARRTFSVAPLVRASGNAVIVVLGACALASAMPGHLEASSWLTVAGYPLGTLGSLLASARRCRRLG